MNYFVGFNLGSTLTGIEKAMINRTNLFKKQDCQLNVFLLNGIDF